MKGKKTHPSGRAWWREYRVTCLVLAAAVAVFIAARLIAVPAASGNSEPEEYAEYENGVITQILADNTVTDPTSDGAARGEQLLLVDVKTGQYAGETLQVYNYVGPLYGGTLKEGQGVTLIISTYSGGTHTATVFEYNRTLPLIVIVGLFLLVTVLVGGKVGAKSLVGLAVTLACLFWILIPLLMKGAPTLLTTLLVCAYITVVTLTILGGFRRKTVCAMVGTLAGVALAMAFGLAAQALLQVDGLRLSDVEPLLQLRALKTPTFAYSAVIVTVVNSALAVGSVILPIYLQNVLGLTAFETGILMTPGAVATIFLSPVSGMLFDRFGPRVIAIVGLTGLTASLAALSFVDDKTMVEYLVAFYVIQSSGLTLANMPVTTWGINALPNDMIAHGNAISNTGRQVGGAVSTALIVTVMTMVTAANAEAGPVLSTAAGIDVAYGISAAVAGIALVIAVLKVRNVKKQAVASPASQAEAPLEIEMEEAREGAAR